MLKALERNVASVDERMVLLAPAAHAVSDSFKNVDVNADRYDQLIRDVQRFRGSIYLQDGAIERHQLSVDGRHQTDDDKSWHLVILNGERNVSGCIWYLEHEQPALKLLRVRKCPLVGSDEWGEKLRTAVEADIAQANREGIRYAEVGGWAVAPHRRRTSDGLLLALGAYSLSQIPGAALGITTATARHCSSTMLRRIGGSTLKADGCALPTYYDDKYKCEMELLRFDSREPNPKYGRLIDQLRNKLAETLVVTRSMRATAVDPYETVALGEALAHPSSCAA